VRLCAGSRNTSPNSVAIRTRLQCTLTLASWYIFSQPLCSWGESAGAISVSLQMLTNGGDTEGLFHAAVMQSGSPIPVGDITNGQKYYDAVVSEVGCSGATDTLACLRTVSYAKLHAAMDNSPSIFTYQVIRSHFHEYPSRRFFFFYFSSLSTWPGYREPTVSSLRIRHKSLLPKEASRGFLLSQVCMNTPYVSLSY